MLPSFGSFVFVSVFHTFDFHFLKQREVIQRKTLKTCLYAVSIKLTITPSHQRWHPLPRHRRRH
jgi:hypothetical protein